MKSLGKINHDKDLLALISINENNNAIIQSKDEDLLNDLNSKFKNSEKLDDQHLKVSTSSKSDTQQVWAQTMSYCSAQGKKPEMNIQFKGLKIIIGIIGALALMIGLFRIL